MEIRRARGGTKQFKKESKAKKKRGSGVLP